MAITYNGISLPFPQTEIHTNGPVKDPSGSDQLYTEIKIKARSLINVNFLPAISSDTSAAQVLARIRHYLTQPRKPLYYDLSSVAGTSTPGIPNNSILNIPGGRDDATGPWPDADAFSAVYTTPDTIEVTWACTVCIRDCGSTVPDGPLSLRWEDSISWDETWKATYRRSGTCIISSRDPKSIDWYRRNTISPTVNPGFRRKTANYVVSKDGLSCNFDFVDEQIRFAPPAYAVRLRITQSESYPLVNAMRHGEVVVNLVGMQSASVVELARWALTIAKARVWVASPLSAKDGTVIGDAVMMTDETDDGLSVTMSIRYKVPPREIRTGEKGGSSFWRGVGVGAVAGGAAGSLIGGVGAIPGAVIGGVIGGVVNSSLPTPPPVTVEGKTPTRSPFFPWIGEGTDPTSASGKIASWADPAGQIAGPSDGVNLAPTVKLFAALLQDPCGSELDASLSTTPETLTELKAFVPFFNTPAGGSGGASPTDTALVTATLTNFALSKVPTTATTFTADGNWKWDGLPAVYDHWQCLSEYIEDPGVVVMPTCNPDGDNIAVTHSSTMICLRKKWAARRVGAPPNLPPKESPTTNFIYTGGNFNLREMGTAADGVSIIYEASGVYEYQALNAGIVELTAEIPPFLSPVALSAASGWAGGGVSLSTGTTVPPNPSTSTPSTGLPVPGTSTSPLGSGTLVGGGGFGGGGDLDFGSETPTGFGAVGTFLPIGAFGGGGIGNTLGAFQDLSQTGFVSTLTNPNGNYDFFNPPPANPVLGGGSMPTPAPY